MPARLHIQSGRNDLADALLRRSWLSRLPDTPISGLTYPSNARITSGASDPFSGLVRDLGGRDRLARVPFLELELQAKAHGIGCVERIPDAGRTSDHLAYPAGRGARLVRLECGPMHRDAPPEFFEDAFDRLADDVDAIVAARRGILDGLPGIRWDSIDRNQGSSFPYTYNPSLFIVETVYHGTQRHVISSATTDGECTTFAVTNRTTLDRVDVAATAHNIASIAFTPQGGDGLPNAGEYCVPASSTTTIAFWRQLFSHEHGWTGGTASGFGLPREIENFDRRSRLIRVTGSMAWLVDVSTSSGTISLSASCPATPVISNPTPYPGTVYARAVRPDPATGSANRSAYDPLGLDTLPATEGDWWSRFVPAWGSVPLFGATDRSASTLLPWTIRPPANSGIAAERLPATGTYTFGYQIHPDDVVLELDLDAAPASYPTP